jgi:2-haloacid dehalogenase
MINFHDFEVMTLGCFGTLIDWQKGLLSAMRPLYTSQGIVIGDKKIVRKFIQYESEITKKGYIPYKEVLKKVLIKIGHDNGFVPTIAEINTIVHSIKEWVPFPDVLESLQTFKKQYKLALIANIEKSILGDLMQQFNIEFDWIFTADEVQTYKPSLEIFKHALNGLEISPSRILHVGHSLSQDIAPAKELKMTTAWVNRNIPQKGVSDLTTTEVEPDLEIPDLKTLLSFTS